MLSVTGQEARIELIESLPVLQRLALNYAPSAAQGAHLALFSLDARLAGIVRNAREPALAQLRLAWWREQLSCDPATWPRGDRLLALLAEWPEGRTALAGLVDAWEAMTGPVPLAASAIEGLADARAMVFASLATTPQTAGHALRLGRGWALADIACHLSHGEEQRIALDLARSQDWTWARLPRELRPLAVLHGIAGRNLARGRAAATVSPGTLVIAIRLGLFGR